MWVAPATGADRAGLKQSVTRTIRPLMARYGIPGMAVGVVAGGEGLVFNFGVASKETGQPVADDTLFEVGSDTKTFTATLAAYAVLSGQLDLSDPVSRHLPTLKGSAFDQVRLLDLGTHTAGGLPLQVPDGIANDGQLVDYFRSWKPAYAPGTTRVYSNPSIGLLGWIAARSLGGDFVPVMEGRLFPALGLTHTYLVVPAAQQARYAQGYTAKGSPVRLAPGVMGAEAYGVRTTAADMLRFVEANLGMLPLDAQWRRALLATHTGYYQVGPMTQDLIWEQYPFPVALPVLLAGNAPRMLFEANPAVALHPPQPPRDDVLLNKTGSTNGFGAYVAFAPKAGVGIVLLANRSYPIEGRVTAGYEILRQLEGPETE